MNVSRIWDFHSRGLSIVPNFSWPARVRHLNWCQPLFLCLTTSSEIKPGNLIYLSPFLGLGMKPPHHTHNSSTWTLQPHISHICCVFQYRFFKKSSFWLLRAAIFTDKLKMECECTRCPNFHGTFHPEKYKIPISFWQKQLAQGLQMRHPPRHAVWEWHTPGFRTALRESQIPAAASHVMRYPEWGTGGNSLESQKLQWE